MEDSPEPIDFDFFAEDDKPRNSGVKSPSSKVARNRSRSTADKHDMHEMDAAGVEGMDSVRSSTNSQSSSVSFRVPTGSPHNEETLSPKKEHKYQSTSSSCSDEEDSMDRSKQSDNLRVFDKNPKIRSSNSSDSVGGGSPTTQSKAARPKTSKTRTTKNSQIQHHSSGSSTSSSHSRSSSDSKHGDSNDDCSTDSDSNSDSVTDVSPMQSPVNSPSPSPPRLQYSYDSGNEIKSTPKKGFRNEEQSKQSKESVHFKGPSLRTGKEQPPASKFKQKNSTRLGESEARELSRLLRAVLELEETPQKSQLLDFEQEHHRPASAKRPMSRKPMPHQRMNMSFTNEEVRRIDRENQRLLHNIVHQSPGVLAPVKKRMKSARMRTRSYGSGAAGGTGGHVSHSAVLRQKEQRRIEMENMKILQRIEASKPSGDLQHDKLVKDFTKQQQYAAQVAKAPMRPLSAKKASKSSDTSSRKGISKASSMQSLRGDYSHASADTAGSSKSRSRPTSAKYGPRVPASSRPAWDDHWTNY